MQVGNEECLGTKPAASFPSVLKTGGVGLCQLLEKPPVWESLSSANGRQTPRRAVEIAWKRLKRDPDSVVSLAFHCSWQIQEGTLLMKTLQKHWMLMKTNNLIPRCSWHRLWHDGRRKMLINRPIILKLCYIVFYQEQTAILIIANAPQTYLKSCHILRNNRVWSEQAASKMPFCIMNVMGGQHLKTFFSSQAIVNFLWHFSGWHLPSTKKL